MAISPLAGKPVDPSMLINVPRLVTVYYTGRPDPSVPGQRVTSDFKIAHVTVQLETQGWEESETHL